MNNDYTPDEMLAIYEDIKKRVHARFEMRTQFLGNLAGFAGVMFVSYVLASVDIMPHWMQSLLPWVMGLWLIGLCVQTANWLMFELRERAIRREIEQAGFGIYSQYQAAAKRKRRHDTPPERLVQLSDDGEIVDLYADDGEGYESHYG